MREVEINWGNATKVAWSLGWRFMLFSIPAYMLGSAAVPLAIMAGEPFANAIYLVFRSLEFAAIALAFIFAVKIVLGRSYSESYFPRVTDKFRLALVAEG